MHRVRDIAQRVDDQLIEIVQQRERGIRNGAEVRQVGGAAKAEAEDFHVAVQKRNRSEREAQKPEGRLRFKKGDAGNRAELGLAVEYVGKRAADDAESFLVGVNRERGLLSKVVGSNVVEAHDVIAMAVR